MTQATWSLQDAKNRFSTVVEAARREPQFVTKHGRPSVVVIGAEEYDRLKSIEATGGKSFIDHLLDMPKDDGEFERLDFEPRDVEF
jgi:antitoxin Phd